MSDYDLSRRKVLGAVGTVGGAAALGASSTIAFFSDEEQFANDQLVAGELDMKVDWQQTYDGPEDSNVYGSAGKPYVNAFPDTDSDGKQDEIKTRQELADEAGLPIDSPSVETLFRDQFADIPDDWARPLIELEDLKPGDSGEITFSLHLFDNPGYIWMIGRCHEDAENGFTEPEAKDPDEDGIGGSTGGELAEEIQVEIWYDDGDNEAEEGEVTIFEGSLSDAQLLMCSGFPLDGNPATPFSPVNLGGSDTLGDRLMAADGGSDTRECFENSTTHHIGFRWELPVDHGNEIQSDSNTFDIGFYTQQCRHNDGSANGVPSLEDPPDWLCSNWEWCRYEVIEIIETFEGEDCPLTPRDEDAGEDGDIICFGCRDGQEDCELEEGETTKDDDNPFTVYETPKKENPLCRVHLESLRDDCEDECRGHHHASPVPLEAK